MDRKYPSCAIPPASAILHRRCHQCGLAALGLGGFEIELDLDTVGVDQEQLVEPLIADAALLEIDALLLEMVDHVEEAGGAERHVIDDAGPGGRGGFLAEIFEPVLRGLGAAMGEM